MSGITQVAKNLGGVISRNSPTILTGLAVAGLVSTAILAVKATPKALRLLEEKNADLHDSRTGQREELTKLEAVRTVYKCYIPTAAVAIATIACIVASNSIHLRRSAALASVLSLTEAGFREYREKVVETIGRNKEMRVRDDVSADTIAKNPPQGPAEVIFTSKGECLCYDTLTWRYFKSDIEHIRRIINNLNDRLVREMFVTVNDLYYELGLAGTKLGDDMGWDIERGMLDIHYSSQLAEDGTPCLVMNYQVTPKFR